MAKITDGTLMVDRTSSHHSSPTHHTHQENPRPSRLRCCRLPLVCVDFLLAAASTSSINYAGLQCYGNEVQSAIQ
ncbi:uncharacterized protein CCOS01_10751 [Colletotrichum costaricense]|uniref:Uncharacterized protein n=1 Tax=Colletotrichum costaricense TaxID=1209916 RepID=A0AAI9YSA8_9PEZI|nr:uncharacterized protein CCOS01_10751 [Colletotrichum costaricense]KAI3551826.1 hypothetical protein CSPX01_00502 [Colletotrichum filicis]KAK1520632.1 hypothetical protein CCOS01_10751 [Colletotrichum costaricense]